MSSSEPALLPLTWAQQAWVTGPPILDRTDAWRHEVSVPVRLTSQRTHDRITAALARLVTKHPALRAQLCGTPGTGLRQRVLPADSVELAEQIREYAVFSAAVDGGYPPDQLSAHVAALAAADVAPNVTVMMPAPGSRRQAMLSVAHSFVDAGGAAVLAAALRDELRAPGEGQPQDGLYRTLEFENSRAAAVLSASGVRHRISMARLATEYGYTDLPSADVKRDVPAVRFSSRTIFQLLARAGQGSRLSRSAMMLSLTLIAYNAVLRRRGVLVATPVANRPARGNDFVGLAMTTGWLADGARHDEPVADLTRRIAARMAQCARHGRFDPQHAHSELTRLDLPTRPELYYNYWEQPDTAWIIAREHTGRTDLPRRVPGPTMLPSGGSGCPFEVNVYVVDQLATIQLKYDDVVFTRPMVEQFVGSMTHAMAQVHREPVVSVADLLPPG